MTRNILPKYDEMNKHLKSNNPMSNSSIGTTTTTTTYNNQSSASSSNSSNTPSPSTTTTNSGQLPPKNVTDNKPKMGLTCLSGMSSDEDAELLLNQQQSILLSGTYKYVIIMKNWNWIALSVLLRASLDAKFK